MLQRDNRGATVATQTLARRLDIGLLFDDMGELAAGLRDRGRLAQLGANVRAIREQFTFDCHADRLIAFFREVIGRRRGIGRSTDRLTTVY